MSIRITIDPDGLGQPTRGIPVVVCDACQDVVYRAAEGLWLWKTDTSLATTTETADSTQTTTALYTVHTDEVSGCLSMFIEMHDLEIDDNVVMTLETLPIFLGETMAVDWEQARRQAKRETEK